MKKQYEVVRPYHAVPVGTVVEFDVVPRALKSHVREIKAKLVTAVPKAEVVESVKAPTPTEKPQPAAAKK